MNLLPIIPYCAQRGSHKSQRLAQPFFFFFPLESDSTTPPNDFEGLPARLVRLPGSFNTLCRAISSLFAYFFLPCLYPLRVFVAISTSLRPLFDGESLLPEGLPELVFSVPLVLYSRYKASLYRLPGKHNRLVCTFSLFFLFKYGTLKKYGRYTK